VLQDVVRGLVSEQSAERDYGVVIRDAEVVELRRPPRQRPFFDRGPGYEILKGMSER
jgi:hypothetical protein